MECVLLRLPRLAVDMARIRELGLQPLPEGSTWRMLGGEELEPLFACTDAIDPAWLLRLLDREEMPEHTSCLAQFIA